MRKLKISNKILFVSAALLALLRLTTSPSYAQVYKWTDEQGVVHYTNDPYKAQKGGVTVQPQPAKNKEPVEETATADAPDENATGEASGKKGSVTLMGDIEFEPSASGKAVVVAKIRNDSPLPVRDVNLDVMIFTPDKRRVDYAIPFTGGRSKPDRLAAGESGTIEYETDLELEEVFSHKYRLTWRNFELTAPPKDGQKAPSDVIHKVIKGTPDPEAPRETAETGSPAEKKKEKAKIEKPEQESVPKSLRWQTKIQRKKMREKAAEEAGQAQ